MSKPTLEKNQIKRDDTNGKPQLDVYLGVPTYDNRIWVETHEALAQPSQKRGFRIMKSFVNSSLLAHGFNQLWAHAQQMGPGTLRCCTTTTGRAATGSIR